MHYRDNMLFIIFVKLLKRICLIILLLSIFLNIIGFIELISKVCYQLFTS